MWFVVDVNFEPDTPRTTISPDKNTAEQTGQQSRPKPKGSAMEDNIVKLSFLTRRNSNKKRPCLLHTFKHVTKFSLRGAGSGLNVYFHYTTPSLKFTFLSVTISMTRLKHEQRTTVES